MAKNLVEELGYLPLAIGQGAANIVDQQLSFAEYIRLYQEKKHRMCLMQTTAHDFANRPSKLHTVRRCHLANLDQCLERAVSRCEGEGFCYPARWYAPTFPVFVPMPHTKPSMTDGQALRVPFFLLTLKWLASTTGR